jgi:hypothetical protein
MLNLSTNGWYANEFVDTQRKEGYNCLREGGIAKG